MAIGPCNVLYLIKPWVNFENTLAKIFDFALTGDKSEGISLTEIIIIVAVCGGTVILFAIILLIVLLLCCTLAAKRKYSPSKGNG